MRRLGSWLAIALLALPTSGAATTFSFVSDPFAGTTALTTPGRQVVGGEALLSFSIGSDVFAFEPTVFGVAPQVLFANDVAANLPTSGVNVVVLQTTDDDSNPMTAFGAGSAATLIADRISVAGPGFFVYFNSGLDLPRLVFSTDLSDETADLKILARLTNLAGQSAALPTFTAANFTMIPEPSSLLLLAATGALWTFGRELGRGRRRDRGLAD